MIPPGQKARDDFPRFGLPQYANRFPSNTNNGLFEIRVNGQQNIQIDLSSIDLPWHTLTADFHCVTTWSYSGAQWRGVRFVDLFNYLERHAETERLTGAVFCAQDGYKTSLLLEDLLHDDVLVVDTLDGEALSIEHGAPSRLIVPSHYGYKNVKHLSRIEFYNELPVIKRGISAFLDHPRARVNKEERGRWVPGWMLRYVYRLLINGAVKDFDDAMRRYKGKQL